MQLYIDTLENFLQFILIGQEDKESEIIEYFKTILYTKLDVKLFNTHVALLYCKNFDQIAEDFSKREQREKPLTRDAIRKRSEKVFTEIKERITSRYGKKTLHHLNTR
jgi:hypothetical protein